MTYQINRVEQLTETKIGINARISAYADFDSVLAALGGDDLAKGQVAVVNIINLYARQKGALVEWRDWFVSEIERLTGFAIASHKETRKKKDGTEYEVDVTDETEREYINRFRAAVKEGQAFQLLAETPAGPVPTSVEALETWLQSVSNTKVFEVDATVTEREPKSEKLPEYAIVNACMLLWVGNKKRIGEKKREWRQKFTDAGVDTSLLSDDVEPRRIEDTDKFTAKDAGLDTLEPVQAERVKGWARAIAEWTRKQSPKQAFK